MPDYWKYVVIGDDMIIFPPTMKHSQFKNLGTITSAGSIMLYSARGVGEQVSCFGRSTSLGIASDPQHDERLVHGLMVKE
jgi:hypothetical protein